MKKNISFIYFTILIIMFNFSCGQEPNDKNEIIVTDELNYEMELVFENEGIIWD